jgi:hypothetical protein
VDLIAAFDDTRTMKDMTNERGTQERLLPTPFIASYFSRARAGKLCQPEHRARSAAWAQWSITSLAEMSGLSDRPYVALTLPGRFYDPNGRGPTTRPHLEIRDYILERPAPEFPDRLALMGNGLTFPWWVFSEVTAVRRALFNTGRGDIAPLITTLVANRDTLASSVTALSRCASKSWSVIQELLVTDDDGLSGDAAGDFTNEEVSAFFPAADDLGLDIRFDAKLREKAGAWASRRVGVWQIHSTAGASLGVVTPRLTASSLFTDDLFSPSTESSAALLVRGLVLARLIARYIAPNTEVPSVEPAVKERAKSSSFLRAQPPRAGAKTPEASIKATIAFLQEYPNSDEAWALLSDWAARTKSLLTVGEQGFKASHANALRFMRRAEVPLRDDINVVLPLAWVEKGQGVRVTFTRSSSSTD